MFGLSKKENKMDVEAIYQKHENLLRALTWKHVRTHGGDFESMYSEACWGFLRAIHHYDAAKAPLHIYISICAISAMRDAHRKSAKTTAREQQTKELPDRATTHALWIDILDSLKADARIVVESILEAPEEILRMARGKRDYPGAIARCVLERTRKWGWTWQRSHLAVFEIREALNNPFRE
jgi:hypothetical protein